jgi:hypothetical protein
LSTKLNRYVRLTADHELRADLKAQFKALIEQHVPQKRWAGKQVRSAPMKSSDWDGVGPSRLAAGISRREQEREASLLLPLLHRPEWLEGHEEELAGLQFRDRGLERLRQEIVAWFSEAASLDAGGLALHLQRYGLGQLLDQYAGHLTQRIATPHPADPRAREHWCEMLAAMRHRAALEQERSTADGVPHGDAGNFNRWFYRLDRLLNRDGADDADGDQGSGG